MSDVTTLAEQIAEIWARECQLEEQAILQSDPLARFNLQEEAAALGAQRRLLHEEIAGKPATSAREVLVLALFAGDFFAQRDAGRTDRNVPLRHLHESVISGLEQIAGVTREELGLDFLWISSHDGPGTEG